MTAGAPTTAASPGSGRPLHHPVRPQGPPAHVMGDGARQAVDMQHRQQALRNDCTCQGEGVGREGRRGQGRAVCPPHCLRKQSAHTCWHVHSSTSRLALLSARTRASSYLLAASNAAISTRGSTGVGGNAALPAARRPAAASPCCTADGAASPAMALLASRLRLRVASPSSPRIEPARDCSCFAALVSAVAASD